MKRYIVWAGIEQSPHIASVLAAASISVAESAPESHASGPRRARGITLAVDAHSGYEALEEVRQALRRWGEIAARWSARSPVARQLWLR